ncbi:MAG: PAS domain S-box protein [Pseudomonadota bacterium]
MKRIVVLAVAVSMLFLTSCHQKSKSELLLESMPVALVTTDMDGVILSANPAFQQMLGYSTEELNKLNYKDMTPEKWHRIEADYVNEALNTSIVQFDKEYTKKDGTIIPISITGWVTKDEAGKPIGTGAIVVERRR